MKKKGNNQDLNKLKLDILKNNGFDAFHKKTVTQMVDFVIRAQAEFNKKNK